MKPQTLSLGAIILLVTTLLLLCAPPTTTAGTGPSITRASNALQNNASGFTGPAQITPKITDVSGSTTPNGYAGYITQGQTGFILSSSNASFGSTPGAVVIGSKILYANNI